MGEYDRLQEILLAHANEVKGQYKADWLDERPLSEKSANKFLLACILDYQVDANVIWDRARKLSEETFGDPPHLWNYVTQEWTEDEWAAMWRVFRLHRFPAAHARVWRIGNEIVHKYGGDARRIWQGRDANEVLGALEGMRVGPEISRMIVGALISQGLVRGTGDLKADIHVRRVLGRVVDQDLSPLAARQLAKAIYATNPWDLDIALYDIGKTLCRKNWVYCEECSIGGAGECADFRNYNRSLAAGSKLH